MNHYYLVHDGDHWKFRAKGTTRAIRSFARKVDGMTFSVGYMRKHGGSLRVQKRDGTFQEERTYPRSQDPRRFPG